MAEGSKKIWGGVVAFLVIALIAVVSLVGYVNRQLISDQLTIWGYTPTSEVLQVKERLDLTDRGSFVFLASSPTLEQSQLFNQQCAQVEHSDEGHMLGCFSDQSIHLFKVNDPRLDGIVEVTAAHELLHAVYSRTTGSDRTKLNNSLRQEYDKIIVDHPEVKERMSVYSTLSDSQFVNELHSVLGTEVSLLSAELEKHYADTFSDRTVILNLFNTYHSVFTQLQAQAKELEAQMHTLGDAIEAGSQTYQEAITTLNADITLFNERARTGSFTSQSTFNAQRAALLSRSDALDSDRQVLESDVASYNTLREKLLSLDAESKELNRVIDSNLAPAPSV